MTTRRPEEHRKVYTVPRLTRFGRLQDLTRAKRGTKNDGGGKPATKSSGSSA